MPCWELFEEQDDAYRQAVLGSAPARRRRGGGARSAGTAGSASDGAFVGMSGFGACAPAPDLYRHFGITPEAVAAAALQARSREKET